MSDNQNQNETRNTADLPPCTKSFDQENHRLQDDDEPCVDGENRDKK